MLTLDKIYHAAYVLRGVARRTDMIPAPKLRPDSSIFLKSENLQTTGSFKLRGAYYKISQLSPEEKERGVIACSAGNHAQGVALAAQRSGIPAVICIPDGAPISKVENTKSYGARVELVKGVYDDAYQRACELQKETGYTFIHPFNDPDVIAGQGTIGLELLDQLPDLDAVMVPVGGHYTVGPEEAWEVVEALSPRVILPMHYRSDRFGFDVLGPVEDFLDLGGRWVRYDTDTLEIHPGMSRHTALLTYGGCA